MTQRILIIDDDVALLDSFRRWMKRELKCEVHCAADREEAEALLDSYEYALVITDLSLSSQRLEGLDLIERVQNSSSKPKLITLTGNSSREVRSIALLKGANVFLEKPTPIREIIDIARDLIGSGGNSSAAEAPAQGRVLSSLLDDAGIEIYFQPIFRIEGGQSTVVGVECLSRGPSGTPFERADALFAYARRKHSAVAVDQRCISLALQAARRLPESVSISLNVHASTLGRCTTFAEWLLACASANGISCARIVVEIVEHAPVWNKTEFLRTLDELRHAGIRIALDDIGLGNSNYQMIIDSRPDCFKIDRYFIHGIHEDPRRRAVVASIAQLAKDFGGVVVAEGVERDDDLAELGKIGIVLMQSYRFCPPIRATEFSLESCTSMPDVHARPDPARAEQTTDGRNRLS